MNGRRAKAYRRFAEAATVGKPAVEYETVPGIQRNGVGTIRLKKGCTRSVYQAFKRRRWNNLSPANMWLWLKQIEGRTLADMEER